MIPIYCRGEPQEALELLKRADALYKNAKGRGTHKEGSREASASGQAGEGLEAAQVRRPKRVDNYPEQCVRNGLLAEL